MIGGLLLGAAGVTAMLSALTAALRRSGSDTLPVDRWLLTLTAGLLWSAVATLIWFVMTLDTRFVYVIEQTRPGMSRALRFSALWSGAEGSLLFFTAIATTALVIGHRHGPRWQRVGVGLTAAGLVFTSWRGAYPFEQVLLPPLSGVGMAPILEHFAMIIHPPALYIGMCSALTPALVRDTRTAHRLAMISMTILTVALGLGSAWAYVELGWGGWWAWDPIENVALIVWLLLAAALHWQRMDTKTELGTGVVGANVLWALCWPAVIGGATLTRTSLRTSVHAFADASQLASWLWPLVVLSAIGAAWRIWESSDGVRPTLTWWSGQQTLRRVPQVILVLACVIIAAGTYRPFVEGDGTAGFFYSRTLFPVVIAGAVLLATVPLWRQNHGFKSTVADAAQWGLPAAAALTLLTTMAGWRAWYQLTLAVVIGFAVGPVLATGRQNAARLAGHLGILLILFGALAGTASTESVIRLNPGEVGELDGHSVELISTDLISEDPLQAGAVLRIDGSYDLTPSVTVFPERSLRLPEVSTRTTPWLDTQAILRDVHPTDGALFTVLFRPWNQLVWWGVALLAAATGLLLGVSRPLQVDDQRSSEPVDGRRV